MEVLDQPFDNCLASARRTLDKPSKNACGRANFIPHGRRKGARARDTLKDLIRKGSALALCSVQHDADRRLGLAFCQPGGL